MNMSLPNFNNANVLVIGDIMLDRYWHGSSKRISPEAPVPVVKVENIEERPGGAANVAKNIASLGSKVTLTGYTGNDEAAESLNAMLNLFAVNCAFVKLADKPTITKLRVLSQNQQLLRMDIEESFSNISNKEEIKLRVKELITHVGAVVLSDYSKGTLNSVADFISYARESKIPVLIDPKGTDFERYRGATLLTPNLSEFEAVVGHCANEDDIVVKGLELIEKYDLEALLVTRSENGMTLLQKGKEVYHMPTQAKEVYDVTGAGDTVIGVLAAALSSGVDLPEACRLSNIAAGIVVGKVGTSTVTPQELNQAMDLKPENTSGILSEQELESAVQLAKNKKERIVMTNGVFDILHSGHVSYLLNAKKQGDRLIVAVNSDASTKRLKGENRPVNSELQRMQVLAALGCVDWVVCFDDNTPQNLIARILPDILVKGGDYHVDEIAGADEVIKAGGEVRVLNYESGISTTNIINSIQALVK